MAALPDVSRRVQYRGGQADTGTSQDRSRHVAKTRVSQKEIAEVMSKEDKDRLDSISQRLLQMFTGYGLRRWRLESWI